MALNIFGGLLFGTIGFIALIYGRRQSSIRTIGVAVALMVYPYFISNTAVMYLVGAVLVAALLVFRD